jgi:hypothetical protein
MKLITLIVGSCCLINNPVFGHNIWKIISITDKGYLLGDNYGTILMPNKALLIEKECE